MANNSFSGKVKEQLAEIEVKKKCCRYTEKEFENIDKKSDNHVLLSEAFEKCRCDGCRTAYIRKLYETYGSVTDPEKSYHLDFSFLFTEEAETVGNILAESGFDFRQSTRKNKHILYIKNSADIEDFLVYIGAAGAAFEVMNSKIVHEFRNSVNRQVNCDTANIEKQLQSSKKYINAIEYLKETDKIDSLSPELKETAVLKSENVQLNLADLGAAMNPPVSKSGMRHRLEKILETAIKLGYKE